MKIVDDRIYLGEDDQWYYRARGNSSVGPFDTRAKAETALAKQVRSWTGRAHPRAVWPKDFKSAKIFGRSATRHS